MKISLGFRLLEEAEPTEVEVVSREFIVPLETISETYAAR